MPILNTDAVMQTWRSLSQAQREVLRAAAEQRHIQIGPVYPEGRVSSYRLHEKTLNTLVRLGLVERRHYTNDPAERAAIEAEIRGLAERAMVMPPSRWETALSLLEEAGGLKAKLARTDLFLTEAAWDLYERLPDEELLKHYEKEFPGSKREWKRYTRESKRGGTA